MGLSNRFSEKSLETDYIAIQKFLNDHRDKDRLLIDDQQFDELRELFLLEAKISLNPSPGNPLSVMEMVIVALSASLKIDEIAQITTNSPSTIKSSLSRARLKLNASKNSGLVIEAIRKGYIGIHSQAA